jgi:hypothetical protein
MTQSRPAAERTSLDHLVGAREQRWRHVEVERLRGLKVDRELELLCRMRIIISSTYNSR